MVRGRFRTQGSYEARVRVEFVIPGVQTSWNPIKAFQQGLAGERDDTTFNLNAMGGYLCRNCGHIDLYAWFADEHPEL